MSKKDLPNFQKASAKHIIPYEEVQVRGATILFLKEDSLPSIQYQIFFPKAGSDYDDYDKEGKSGLAYMTAYLTEQGAGDLSSTALQEALNQLGTSLSFSVGRQTLSMELSGLSWHKEKLWDIFSAVLEKPHFNKEEWKILQKQFLDARLKRMDNPSAVAGELLRKTLFRDSRGNPSKGTLMSLSNITLSDMKSFYKKNFSKGHPILMVTGQFDEALKKEIVSFFVKTFPSNDAAHSKNVFYPEAKSYFKLLIKEDLLQSHVYMGHPLPPFPIEEPKKILALQIANSILGGSSMASRLFTNLREKKGLTYGTYSHIAFNKFYGLFRISGTTKNSSTKELLEETLKVLKIFYEEGITPEELKKAKMELKSQYLKSMETPEDQLYQYAYYNYYLGVQAAFLKDYPDILDSLSLNYVNQQIKEWISVKDLQIVVYGHPSTESQLKNIKGLPPLQVNTFKEHFKEELSLKPSQQL